MNTFLRYVEHTCEQDQQRPLNSRDRFLQGIELREGGEPVSLPMQQAPLTSPSGHFEQDGGQQQAASSCQVALHGGGHGGGHAGQRLPSPFRHTQVTYEKTK